MSVGVRALPMAGARLLGQTKSVAQGFHAVAGFVQLALPRVAIYLADAVLVLLGALALLFIHLLVMVPVRLQQLRHQVKSLEEQVSQLRREICTDVRPLMPGAGQESAGRRGLEDGGIISRSPHATA